MTFSLIYGFIWTITSVFGQLHLLMIGTELEAVPPDRVSFELCIYLYLRASCVHSDRVCRLYLVNKPLRTAGMSADNVRG